MSRITLFTTAGLASIAWCLATTAADAQANTAPDPRAAQSAAAQDEATAVDEIVVTGSRVVTNGFQAPTPVTVVGIEQLRNSAPTVIEALRQIPQLTGSNSSASPTPAIGSGPQTNDNASLRNLGAERTLVLLDGRRQAPSGARGVTNLALFPMALVKRVDLVTGGASAAYGSDAVAGVVNFILDTDFEGLQIEARGGVASRGDAGSFGFEIAGGQRFLDDRASIIVSADVNSQDELFGDQRPWTNAYWGAIPNPNAAVAGQPSLLLRRDVRMGGANFNGVIITPGPLRDTTFDAVGNPVAFVHGTDRSATLEVGGDGGAYLSSITSDSFNANSFIHGEFEVSDRLKVFAEGSYGISEVSYDNIPPFNLGAGAWVVRADNPYLPASIRNVMTANNIASFQLGKFDGNIGRNRVNNNSYTYNALAGFSADLGRGFTLDGYYSHGEALLRYGADNNRIQARSRLAADAVLNTATGQIVCRSTLTAPTNGCVPFNPIGSAPLTQAQRDYMTATSFARSITTQDIASAEVRGNLFSTPAGPIAVAAGLEYRSLSTDLVADPISQAAGFTSGNLASSSGSYDVKEGFAEVLVPVLRDLPLARALDVNAAVRRTEYSTSGSVTTWKVGATDEVLDGLRLRLTYSQDIRAPNIAELFGGVSRTTTSVRDPQFGGRVALNIFAFSGSNAELTPEEARTFTAGVSYRPAWAPRLGLSVDYYDIDITDAIAAVTTQDVVDRCAAGDQSFCALVVRNTNQEITQITATLRNTQQANVRGVDFEANYNWDGFGGTFNVRGIATYLDTYTFASANQVVIEQAGVDTRPKWRGTLQAAWQRGPLTLSVQERYIGSLKRFATTTIDDNSMEATFYTTLNVRYSFDRSDLGNPELFLSVNNLFDQEPRVGPTQSCSLGLCYPYSPQLYDLVGRQYTFGVRARF